MCCPHLNPLTIGQLGGLDSSARIALLFELEVHDTITRGASGRGALARAIKIACSTVIREELGGRMASCALPRASSHSRIMRKREPI